MRPSQTLIDRLYFREIEDARRMTPEQKLLAGGDLFDYACEITKAGIRAEHPDADENEVRRIFRERLELAERKGW